MAFIEMDFASGGSVTSEELTATKVWGASTSWTTNSAMNTSAEIGKTYIISSVSNGTVSDVSVDGLEMSSKAVGTAFAIKGKATSTSLTLKTTGASFIPSRVAVAELV